MACDKIIELRDVSMAWNSRMVLQNIDMTIYKGDFVAITGPNGGGKTTLLRLILKLLKPTKGDVVYYSSNTTVSQLSIGYLPQKNMIDSHFPITLHDVVSSGLLGKGLNKNQINEKVSLMLQLVGLEDFAQQSIGQLSGGQLQRGLFARALIGEPQVLVLDEPLSYLDKTFEKQIYDILRDYQRRATIILVSHEMSEIASMANRHFIVNHIVHECSAAVHYMKTECS